MKPIWTLDCETDPFQKGQIPLPFLWNVYDGEKHHTFNTTEDCVGFCEGHEVICFAHNGGKFDYHQPGFLACLDNFAEVSVISGRLSKFKIGLCEFRDSMNLFPMGLKKYKKDDIDYTKLHRSVRHLHMPEIIRYCQADCRYLHEMVMYFIDTYGLNLTLAGAAMKFWQNRTGRTAPKSTANFYENMKHWYYGGRVECFSSGLLAGEFSMIDINSAYPRAMLEDHPISTVPIEESIDGSESILPQAFYVVDAVANGCFPNRGKTSLEFPDDGERRRYYVTGWEMLAALETGTVAIFKWVKRVRFAHHVEFSKYVNYFYDIKKSAQKDSLEYIGAKLMMNSLYGKFGANPDEYRTYMVAPKGCVDIHRDEGWETSGELGPWDLMERPLDDEKMRFYNVATAASITGYVRAFLFKTMHTLRKNGASVLYCDTDSIVFSGDGGGIDYGKELGQWGVDGVFDKGGIAGKKIYAFRHGKGAKKGEWKTSCKGARLDWQEIMRVCQGDTVSWTNDAPSYSIHRAPVQLSRKIRATAKISGI